MTTTVEGVYRNGHVELAQQPSDVPDDTRVLVTFLAGGPIDLSSRGIDPEAAAELRNRLASFEEEWSTPEMSQYDNYDAHHQQLEAR